VRSRTGLQSEITTSLSLVVLSGLAVVALGMATVALHGAEREAAERLRIGARQLERAALSGPGRLADLAALIRALPADELPSEWWVVTAGEQVLARSRPDVGELPSVWSALPPDDRARTGLIVQGLPPRDLVLATRLVDRGGASGTLIGRVPRQVLAARALPLLRVATWGLALTAAIFVVVGAWLLRRRIVIPVQALQAAARRIAHGDLGARVHAVGTDELADLGRHFNDMGESLAREREALLEAQRRLLQSERLAAAGRLASGVAHEIGNPLAAILGYAEIALRDRGLSERTRETQGLLREEALRVRALIRELLDLSRSSRVEVTALGVAELLERLRARLGAQPLLEGIELAVQPGASSLDGLEVEADAGRVEQVLVNLVENAAHALGKQTQPSPRIELGWRRVECGPRRRLDDFASVAIDVTDNGPGIDAEHLPHVFEPFFTTKDPGEGTGLGLWNGHRVAELLGGRLEVESAPGRTMFSLLLPAADTPRRSCPDADS
jgi:signal transduction histidine kinase